MAQKWAKAAFGTAAAIASLASTTGSANAQDAAITDFTFDAQRCDFGPTLDAMFARLQQEFDTAEADAGRGLRTYDNMEETQLRVSQAVGRRLGPLTVTNIAIRFDERMVFFAEDFVPAMRAMTASGVEFEDAYEPNIYGVYPDIMSVHVDARLNTTGEGEYNSATGEMDVIYDPLGKTRLLCGVDRFLRTANEAGRSVSDLAMPALDLAVWGDAADAMFARSGEARGAGEREAALEASRQLLALLDERGAGGAVEYAVALHDHSANLAALGREGEARQLLARALEIAESELTAEHPFTTDVVEDYALILMELGDAAQARPLMNRVYWLRSQQLGDNDPVTLLAMVRRAEATAALTADPEHDGMLDLYDALAEGEEAFARNAEVLGLNDPQAIRSMVTLAAIHSEVDQWSDDASYWLSADKLGFTGLLQSRAVMGPAHPDTLHAASTLASIRLAQPSQLGMQSLEPAREAVGIFAARRDTLLTSPAGEAQRLRDIRNQRVLYNDLADALWHRAEYDARQQLRLHRGGRKQAFGDLVDLEEYRPEAFSALQQAMSGSTDRAIAEAAARRSVSAADAGLGALVEQRQALSDEWADIDARLTQMLGRDGDAELREQLRSRQDVAVQDLAAIDSRLQAEAPEYYAFVRASALSEAEAQALMGADEAMLMVVPTQYGTHAILVTDQGIFWNRADLAGGEVDSAVQRLLWDVGANVDVDVDQSIAWASEGEGAYPFDRGTAHRLYTQIVEPFAHLLEGKRHLFVAAGGSLSSLPFALLVSEAPQGADGDPAALRATSWFGDDHALIQIPSIQSLQLQRALARSRGDAATGRELVGFGDPVLDGQALTRGGGVKMRGSAATRGGVISTGGVYSETRSSAGAALVDLDALRSMARLPGTSREIEALGSFFDQDEVSLFLGESATEANLRNQDLSDARIIALATHALVAGELDGLSEPGLVLTPPDRATPDNDGYLSASEVARLRLNAEWVILSACNTAAGDGSAGAPGLSGLARSFFYAGARGLLASHWPVRDDVAARMTVRTVELMREDASLSRAEALQRAMQDIRSDASQDSASDTLAHPNAWAPFTMIGDW